MGVQSVYVPTTTLSTIDVAIMMKSSCVLNAHRKRFTGSHLALTFGVTMSLTWNSLLVISAAIKATGNVHTESNSKLTKWSRALLEKYSFDPEIFN
jgi:hypothetical protein